MSPSECTELDRLLSVRFCNEHLHPSYAPSTVETSEGLEGKAWPLPAAVPTTTPQTLWKQVFSASRTVHLKEPLGLPHAGPCLSWCW